MEALYRGDRTDGFAKTPSIGPLPWVWIRRMLAERWNVPPWAVDEAPAHEVELELRLMSIDGESRPTE